ncbi:cytochrome b5 domain-containing protein 1 isoform X2 [Amia ocellicauda]|uniref:cytochrome b5 domain-containing protein 1 isoform X2 n=1 Tax=Amia ocellicauda TaxID=2972642 RepID=UPI00346460A3
MRRPRYYSPYEVSMHNTLEDLWVSYLGKVYDLTPLVREHMGDVLLKPIIEAAGKDISHWFNPKTKDVRTHVDPLTSCLRYYTPGGRFLHVPPSYPCSDWANHFGRPWWRDGRYEVCSEETLGEILQRYLRYNAHAASYTWKHEGAALDMGRTLQENGLADEDEEFDRLRLDGDLYTPAICLYFNDDLTEL